MAALLRQRCVVNDKKASLVAYQAVRFVQENSLERRAIPNPFGNKMFNYAILLSLSLMLMVAFVPGLNTIFGIQGMTGQQWMIVVAAAMSVITFVEIMKAILRGIGYDKKVNQIKE